MRNVDWKKSKQGRSLEIGWHAHEQHEQVSLSAQQPRMIMLRLHEPIRIQPDEKRGLFFQQRFDTSRDRFGVVLRPTNWVAGFDAGSLMPGLA